MIDFTSILKVALPIVGSILLDENIGPIKQENPYRSIVKNTIDTTVRLLNSSDMRNDPPIRYNPAPKTPFEIAESKEYKYNFK